MSESRSCRCGCGAPVARTYAKGHGRRRPIAERHIDHLCRNRLCANPAHLEAVTQAENNNRRAALARWGGAS